MPHTSVKTTPDLSRPAPSRGPVAASASRTAGELSTRRLNIMRIGYAVMGVGIAARNWPLLFDRDQPWPLYEGVTRYMLVAMGLLAFLGLRYPQKMLPVLLFESAWKLLRWPVLLCGSSSFSQSFPGVTCSTDT
jgi:hypothetical protein